MLSPKRTKFRKFHKIHKKGQVSNLQGLEFGKFGIQALEQGHLDAKTIEAVRRVLTRQFKRTGQVWIRVFPDVPVSAKPVEVRMGKGKGSTEYWAAKVKPGRIMFEIDGVSEEIAREALRLGAMKLPVLTRVVQREDW